MPAPTLDIQRFKEASRSVIERLRKGEFSTLGAGKLFAGDAPCCILGHALHEAGAPPVAHEQCYYDLLEAAGFRPSRVYPTNDAMVRTAATEDIGSCSEQGQMAIADDFESALKDMP